MAELQIHRTMAKLRGSQTYQLVTWALVGSMELGLWGTPIGSIELEDEYSNIGLSSDPDGLSILQEEVEEMLVLYLVQGLET